MTFDQSSWKIENSRIYNIAGDLRLTEESGPRELAEAITQARSRLRALDGLPDAERAAIDEELVQAGEAAAQDDVDGDDGSGSGDDETDGGEAADANSGGRVARALRRAGALLGAVTGAATAATGAAAAASELGDSLGSLAQWAEQHM